MTPGSYEYGVLTFEARKWRPEVDVEIDDDGTVVVSWTEKSDDFWGSATRSVRFSAEEFDQIVEIRESTRG